MTSQKDHLQKVAEYFSLIDEYFPISNRHHQNTEARLRPTIGWTTTTRYAPPDQQEYEDQFHVQYHQCPICHYSRPQARTVVLEPVFTINSSDHVYQVHHFAGANHANQVPLKSKDDVFSRNQMETQGQNRRNAYQVRPAPRASKSNFGGWRFGQG